MNQIELTSHEKFDFWFGWLNYNHGDVFVHLSVFAILALISSLILKGRRNQFVFLLCILTGIAVEIYQIRTEPFELDDAKDIVVDIAAIYLGIKLAGFIRLFIVTPVPARVILRTRLILIIISGTLWLGCTTVLITHQPIRYTVVVFADPADAMVSIDGEGPYRARAIKHKLRNQVINAVVVWDGGGAKSEVIHVRSDTRITLKK